MILDIDIINLNYDEMSVWATFNKTSQILKDINEEFESITKLNSTDVAFLFVAIIVRVTLGFSADVMLQRYYSA